MAITERAIDPSSNMSSKPPQQSVPSQISTTLEMAQSLATECQMMANALCGALPEATKSSDGDPATSGILPALASHSDQTRAALEKGFMALNRIRQSI